MSAPAIGPRRYVAPVSVRVVEYGAATVSVVLAHDYSGTLWLGSATDARLMAQHMLDAADQADAMARAKREAQRAEEKALARLCAITRQIECRGCRELATRDGLCDLCLEARDRAQRIVGAAGEVVL